MKCDQQRRESTPAPVQPSAVLRAKLGALRHKHVTVAALTGLAMALVVCLELLALAMFVDWWLDLPLAARLISLAGQLAVFSYLALGTVVAPLVKQPDADALALMVEHARPEFRSRLIAALQLTRPGAIPPGSSHALVGALVEETEALAAPRNFANLVPTDRLKKLGALAMVITAIAIAGFLCARDPCADLLQRVFLANIPVPRKTHVFVANGNKVVGLGDDVRLEATVRGIIPATGKLKLEFRSRRAPEFTLEQDQANPARFGCTIQNVQESFRYKLYVNDGESPTFEVKALARPTVATIECEQEFPAYAKMKSTRRALGDLSLLAGSKLKIAVTATKPIVSAALRLVGATNAADLPLHVGKPNSGEWTGEIAVPAKGLSGFSVHLTDTEGMESHDAAVYRIEIVPDQPPMVRLIYPDRKEALVTRYVTQRIGFEAADDFQLAKVRLRYQVDTGDTGAVNQVELDLGGEQPQRLKRQYEWKIGAFAPPVVEGSTIEYWIEAEDNNDATGPGRGTSEHQLLRVVSKDEKRADLLNRAGDSIGTIGEVAGDEEALNKDLGALILERTGPKP